MTNLLITMPAHDGRNATWTTESLLQLRSVTDFTFLPLNHKESFIYRQLCVEKFVNQKQFTHWLSLDSDMGFSPKVFETLISSKKDFICAIAIARTKPRRLAYVAWKEESVQEYNIMEIRYAGLALALVSRKAVTLLEDEFPDTWRLPSQQGNPSMHTWFEPMCIDGDMYLEPDYAFQERYRKCGGKVWGFYPGPDIMHP